MIDPFGMRLFGGSQKTENSAFETCIGAITAHASRNQSGISSSGLVIESSSEPMKVTPCVHRGEANSAGRLGGH